MLHPCLCGIFEKKAAAGDTSTKLPNVQAVSQFESLSPHACQLDVCDTQLVRGDKTLSSFLMKPRVPVLNRVTLVIENFVERYAIGTAATPVITIANRTA